ncbi:MAG: peptide deformylase [Chloroflexi bacterium]|nr:MAG: peptide deformylase [Chloroflexota bacterium]
MMNDKDQNSQLSRLEIVKYPDPRLRETCQSIERIDDSIVELVKQMFDTMYRSGGVGLAAPQVGKNIRLFIANPTAKPGQQEGVYINPEIINAEGSAESEEGCLSIPGLLCKIKRKHGVTIRAINLDGESITQDAEDLLARIFQHEIDHLNGILICDKMSTVAKIANRKLLKDLEEQYAHND